MPYLFEDEAETEVLPSVVRLIVALRMSTFSFS
jgi:hypothetical protein